MRKPAAWNKFGSPLSSFGCARPLEDLAASLGCIVWLHVAWHSLLQFYSNEIRCYIWSTICAAWKFQYIFVLLNPVSHLLSHRLISKETYLWVIRYDLLHAYSICIRCFFIDFLSSVSGTLLVDILTMEPTSRVKRIVKIHHLRGLATVFRFGRFGSSWKEQK